MKRVIIICFAIGIFLGAVKYFKYSFFGAELNNNETLFNLQLIIEAVVLFFIVFFIIRKVKRSGEKKALRKE